MQHLFAFIKDHLASGSEGNVLDEADLETEKRVLDELQMTAADVEDAALDKDLARMIGFQTQREEDELEMGYLEKELQLLEK